MSNIEILEKGVDYTVLHRTVNTPQPYVVAWKFHPQTMDWEQGHYFADRESAFKWFVENDLCNCIHCDKQGCAHREAFRRLPRYRGGLGLCPRLEERAMSKPIRVSVAVGVNGRMANWILPEDCFKKQFTEIRGADDPAAACEAQVQQMKHSLERVGLKKFVWELTYLHALYQMQEELAQEKGAENGNR